MNLSDLVFKAELDEAPECKGLFFRYIESSFANRTNRTYFRTAQEVRLLKRHSCSCYKCQNMLDEMTEYADTLEFGPGIVNGDIVEMTIIPGPRDWETGYIDSWTYKFIKVADDKSSNYR